MFRDTRHCCCEFGGICRSKKSLLNSHLTSHHQEEMEKKRELEGVEGKEQMDCNTYEECSVTFKRPAQLKQYMLSHSFEESFSWLVNDFNASIEGKIT